MCLHFRECTAQPRSLLSTVSMVTCRSGCRQAVERTGSSSCSQRRKYELIDDPFDVVLGYFVLSDNLPLQDQGDGGLDGHGGLPSRGNDALRSPRSSSSGILFSAQHGRYLTVRRRVPQTFARPAARAARGQYDVDAIASLIKPPSQLHVVPQGLLDGG